MTSTMMARGRALAESVVIVGSILLAFGIDAWWDRRSAAEDVRLSLQTVEAELTENLTYFEAVERDHRRVAEGGLEMLGLTEPNPSPEVLERAKFLIGELWVRAGIEPAGTGAASALIASGALARIDRQELRRELSFWPSFIERQQQLVEVLAGENRFHERMVLHVAQLDIDQVNGMGVFAEARAEFQDRAPPASRFSSDYAGLLADRQFESAVASRTTQALIGVELAQGARQRIKLVLQLIEEALR